MAHRLDRMPLFLKSFWRNEDGVILPVVTVMLVVLVGFASLALDAARLGSLRTQMQAAADALALAGARELNQQSGAITRATNAVNNLVTNGLNGMGTSQPALTASVSFYKTLPAASAGLPTVTTALDSDATYLVVKVNAATVSTIFPVSQISNTLSSGGLAVAGFKTKVAFGVSPMFVCNPYETSGMTDTQATQALHAALDPHDPNFVSANLRKLFRMDTSSNTSPGHFGWLQPTSGCNNTPCLNQGASADTAQSLSGSNYSTSGVFMATGNKPVADSINVRFDLYNGNGPSSSYSPAINVRKGYIAGSNGWCANSGGHNGPVPGDYLSAQTLVPASTTLLASAATTSGAAVSNARTFQVASTAGIVSGMSITITGGSTVLGTVATATGTTVTTPANITLAAGTQLTFRWQTADLPLDQQWTGICTNGLCLQGNGQWDCGSYWTINHGALAYSGNGVCGTPALTTASRYDVYNYENQQASHLPTSAPITDWSGFPQGVANATNAESGAPLCAKAKSFTPVWDSRLDPRIFYVAIINCEAQNALGNINGGNSGTGTPVADFAKLFITQPWNSDGQGYLYAEITGLVNNLNDNVIIVNQVQLYR